MPTGLGSIAGIVSNGSQIVVLTRMARIAGARANSPLVVLTGLDTIAGIVANGSGIVEARLDAFTAILALIDCRLLSTKTK
mmetsp:Transcript_22802/g.52488  ORF Transcript_22802/g.52488 Transcript_22802/m.52488 type:complete len:81 (-) Transcript_22802:520-762(-)